MFLGNRDVTAETVLYDLYILELTWTETLLTKASELEVENFFPKFLLIKEKKSILFRTAQHEICFKVYLDQNVNIEAEGGSLTVPCHRTKTLLTRTALYEVCVVVTPRRRCYL